ncbi:hypothetical protein LOD99_4972 [Oopsacas minuta]|uniref:Uncharacterized protein n=1 Tax=Oopsacas minuta TaxID=111878 RepID=A0AAV7JT55_9METZ|nr:hypothetical protein LOD99_4972 [Oopsacas minuta]
MASYFKSAASSYKFGDLTKTTLWGLKEGVHLYTGKDEYEFGDVARKTTKHLSYLAGLVQSNQNEDDQEVSQSELSEENLNTPNSPEVINKSNPEPVEDRNKLVDNLQDGTASNSDVMNIFSRAFWSPRIQHTVIFTPSEEINPDVIWDSFFDRAYELANQCLQLTVLNMDDFVCEEPFLYMGLPSLILIEVVHRSLDCTDGFILSTGMKLTGDNCPEKHMLLFACMQASRGRLKLLQLNTNELAVMKLRLLFAGDDSKEVPLELTESIGIERLSAINAVVAEVTSVAIHLTQEVIFKQKFRAIFESITKNV